MKRVYLILFLVIYTSYSFCSLAYGEFSTAGFFSVKSSPRKVYDFNPGWRFYRGDIKNAEKINFDDSKWIGVNLPHGLELLPENASGGRNYQGISWYRKCFNIVSNTKDKRIFVYFEAIMGKSKVWVNDKLVGEQYGGYLPFAFDITDYVNERSNIIAVKVDNSDDPTYLPGQKQYNLDFSYFGGIYRDAFLIYTSNLYASLPEIANKIAGGGVFVNTMKAKGHKATLRIKTDVINRFSNKPIIIKSIIENNNFKVLTMTSKRLIIDKGSSKEVEQILKLDSVKLWSPDHPNLNYVRTEIWSEGKLKDCFRTRIGIRKIEMRGSNGMFINGELFKQKLIGANRHQDYVYVGNALPNSGQWRDVKLLREGGCNIIRVAHYPMDPAFYDACDELGVFTTSATPGWHFFDSKNPLFIQRMYEDTRRLIRKDRNRPSILMWETALNETPSQPDYCLRQMHKIAHEEYPYNGMYTVTDMKEAIKGGMDLYYHGNNPKINSFIRECGDGSEVDNWYSQNAITRIKMEWGENALIAQANELSKTLSSLYNSPNYCLGGALWAGFEHQRGYHTDPFMGGLINLYRLPKYSYFLWQSQRDIDYNSVFDKPMIYITNELTQVSNHDVIVYSNCDEVRLSFLGKIIGYQKPSSEVYKGLPHPPFIFKNAFNLKNVKGLSNDHFVAELVAEGFKDGKVVIKQCKKYPLRSEKIKLELSNEGIPLIANGSDFVPLRATIVDYNGTKKVLSSEYVYFQIEGEGKIIDNESINANPMKTQMGIATALIQSTLKPGKIKVTAFSNGLKSGTIEFNSLPNYLDMNYNSQYLNSSIKIQNDNIHFIKEQNADNETIDINKMKDRIKELEFKIVGQEQEIQELRSNSAN